MQALELKIPPPALGLTLALLMWATARLLLDLPAEPFVSSRWPWTLTLVLIGIGFDLSGLLAFQRARTTVNPLAPERSSALVMSGVYRLTRNPMYVGMAIFLIAFAIHLGSLWTLLGPLAFVAYITRFQIIPEERALRERFGDDFVAYCSRVRRWL